MSLIPATILTGFLGSGKTTLLKRVLTEAHGQKIAVIENEFGEENIDNDILVSDSQEQIIQMSNGCICCSIREDLRATLSDGPGLPRIRPFASQDSARLSLMAQAEGLLVRPARDPARSPGDIVDYLPLIA